MNKRIELLAEQAKASVPAGLVVEEWIQVYNKNFAELIVKECMEVVKRNIYGPCGEYDYSYSDEKYAADSRAENIYDEIKQHFGVEE